MTEREEALREEAPQLWAEAGGRMYDGVPVGINENILVNLIRLARQSAPEGWQLVPKLGDSK